MWIATICLYTSDVNSCLGLSVILKKYSGIKLCEEKLSLYYYNSSFSLFISLLQKLASNNNNSNIFFFVVKKKIWLYFLYLIIPFQG